MNKGYIYRHWIINDKGIEKSYIGKTVRELQERWKQNGEGYLKKDTKFSRAIKKYGWGNFHHDILLELEHEDIKELNRILSDYEKHYIELYDSYINGYNSTLGGEGSLGFHPVRSEEYIEKQRKAQTGKTIPQDVRKKISESLSGELNPFYGKKHTEETKKKMRENHADFNGGKNPFAKEVLCINCNKRFSSLEEAAKWCGLKDGTSISKCCNGKQKTAGKCPMTKEKLMWRFVEERNDINE